MARSSAFRADSPISNSIEVNDYDDPKRRISNITATSISSFPDSALPSDSDAPGPFYSTAKPRPTYRVGSLRRSPLPGDRLSPSLRPPKHSTRRPRSRGEDSHHEVEQEQQQPAPLILLHVTVLPPRLPWSRTVLDATLSPELKHRFGVLRAQISGLVAQRGILIAHPHEEFELLEESVLEALDLLPERIGSDGQYRPRTPNTIIDGEDNEDVQEAELQPCDTCQRYHEKDAGAGWHTRVYAANGLMRAGAWSAAWSEMERVDVEVLPCISDEMRRRLDDMQAAEESADRNRGRSLLIQSTQPMQTTGSPEQRTPTQAVSLPVPEVAEQRNKQKQLTPSPSRRNQPTTEHNDLPPIYRPKDIPLSLLFRNYLYLLLCDRRNLAILFLVLTLLASTFNGFMGSSSGRIGAFEGELRVLGEIAPMSIPYQNAKVETEVKGQDENVAAAKRADNLATTALNVSGRVENSAIKTSAQQTDVSMSERIATPSSLSASPVETTLPSLDDAMQFFETTGSPHSVVGEAESVTPNPLFLLDLHGTCK